MAKTKKRRPIEIYENYWKFTASWTNIYGTKFNNCLNVIVNYIDHNLDALKENAEKNENFSSSSLYKNLQYKIVEMMDFQGEDATLSARKAINMFVKIGFVYPFLLGYHPMVKNYIRETDKEKKRIIYSKIFYQSSSLASDVTLDNRGMKHVGFFLQTLDKNRTLTGNDLRALMVTDITQYPNGYLTREQLDSQYRFAIANSFEERKYNQISHLRAYLQNFVDLKYNGTSEQFWFADDPDIVDKEFNVTYKRDPIRYRIYRDELKDESMELYGAKVCFFEKKPYKGLVASHIKPCHVCLAEHNDDEAYDVNNGLLLAQNVDQYFNDFDVTFTDAGEMIFGNKIPETIKAEFSKSRLAPEVMTAERKRYMAYHRKVFKERNE